MKAERKPAYRTAREDGLITISELAKHTAFGQNSVWAWVSRGLLPAPTHKYQGKLRLFYTVAEAKEILEYIKANTWRGKFLPPVENVL